MFLRPAKFKTNLLIIIIALISLIWITGKYLDRQADKIVEKAYPRDQKGIINGLQSKTIIQGKNKALLLIHGFADSPALFFELADDIKSKVNCDIYIPLLPFHGRNLISATHFNNQIILDSLSAQINALAKKYQTVTIVGASYGGALLTALINANKIPQNVHIILYAPAFFLKGNTAIDRAEINIYKWWRSYCNYRLLGCQSGYASGDDRAKPHFDKEKSLRYVVMPAILQLYQFDLDHRNELGMIHRPYSLIVAVDDNRVSYDEQKKVCDANRHYCHFYSFRSGKHIIHWGYNKNKFEDLLVKLSKN
jgi:esterase/lipase